MKISFWIPAVVLYVVRVAFSNTVHVGTVLFTTTDLVKKCWTESDKSLLKARLIMQDVLPDPDCIDFSNPEAVVILLDYFHACYQIISTSTYGKLQNLMYLALSDALGGYLRAYVLPFTKRAYYGGQVKYVDAKQIFQLYDDIRVFLKSNGVGWAEPKKLSSRKFYVRPLVITGGTLEACKELFVIEKQGKLHVINSKQNFDSPEQEVEIVQKEGFPEETKKFANPPKQSLKSRWHKPRRRRRGMGRGWGRRRAGHEGQLRFCNFINNSSGGERFLRSCNRTRELLKEMEWEGEEEENRDVRQSEVQQQNETVVLKRVIVPLPVLDDIQTPHTIAVPFLRQPLRNLKTGCSAFILEYYYLAVVKCFIAKGNSRSDIKYFNGQFHSWLMSQVVPHLCEEQWYPGFGGVLRVLQTIKKFGLEMGTDDPALHDIEFMFNEGSEFEVYDSSGDKEGRNKVRDVTFDSGEPNNAERHLITTIIIVSMIWLFIFCAFAFYCQATRGHRLFYEGYGDGHHEGRLEERHEGRRGGRHEGRHESRYDCGRRDGRWERMVYQDKKRDENLQLQFLVRFFKRNNETLHRDDSGRINLKINKERTTLCLPATVQLDESPFAKSYSKLSKEKPSRETEKGDYCSYIGSLLSSVLPNQQYLASFDKLHDMSEGDASSHCHRGHGDQIKMLWKKPSPFFKQSIHSQGGQTPSGKGRYLTTASGTGSEDMRRTTTNSCSACLQGDKSFDQGTASSRLRTTNTSSIVDETKDNTTEKHTSTCNCSESCPFAHTTSCTNSSTQLEEKMSSATMNFFEEIIAKHKPKKRSTQDSTVESETECSTSSESDY